MLRHLIIALLIVSWSHSNSQMTILQEDFEVFPFEGWTDYQDNFGSNWQQCWQNDCGYNGGKSAHHYLCNDGCNKWLVTPQLNVSTSTTVFTFLERFDEFAVQYYEYSGVSISTSSGDPFDGDFVEIYTNDPADLPISWVERTLDLSSYVGQDVFIAFHFNGYWHEWFVDNVAFGPSTFVDAGITEFINPIGTSPDLGIQDIQLTIQNFGTETIQEYTIDWEVNGVVQTQFDQSSADLSPGQSSTVNIGQFDFDMEGDYEIMASLNVMDDFNPANNTLANLYYVTSEKDAAIVSIYPNGYLPDTGIHDVQVEIINEGGTTIQNVNIEWQVDGVDQIVYENGDLNLLSGESVIVTLGQYNFTEGIHELNADINASGEVNPENDIRVDYAAVNTFWESFEGSQYPPEGWQTNWGLKETGFLPAPHGESYHFAGTDNNFFGVALDTLFTPVLEVEAGDQFSFYRKSSTFFPGTLNLVWKDAINNEVSVIQSNISSGNDNFNQVTIDIGSFAGLGKIGFAFSSGSYGEQSIDLITSDANIYQWPIDLSINQYDSDYLARSGDSNLSTVRVKNLGQSTLSGSDYIVRLMTTNGIELTSLPGQDIEEYEELIFEFEYDFPSIGEYKVVAEVVIVGDEFASNNSTRPFRINSVPSDVILVDIGSPDYLGLSFPFDFGGDTWGYSTNDVSQNLYYQAEVDMSGLIYGVTYYGRNIFSNYADLPLKTWVAQTDASSLSEGWQSVDDFTLLSEDTLEIGPGIMEPLFVYFDPPILFSNLSNLNFQHFLENSEWPPAFGGIWASTGEGPERVVSLLNSLEADPIDHPDFYGSHTDHAYTTFVIQPITQSANISGTAFDENNIEFESVEVNVEGQPVEAITDAIGEYSLLPLPYSSYTVTASILGYEDNVEMVELNEPEVTVDFQMIPKPQIDINALVVGSDAPSSPLDMVNISTDGYENYFSVTESNGVLLLEDVYGNAEYHITFSKYGYLDSTITVNVQDLPLDLGTIELQQEFLSPYNVTAALGADVVNVAWMDPITSVKDRFQTDSDVTWFSYTNEPNENVWLGNRFENDEPVTLQSVEVFWDIYFLEIGLVTMEILDENGEVVASSLPFETARDTLMTIDVPNVTMNGDFYVMVHWQDNPSNTHALRLDRSMGITNNAYIKYPGQTPELVSDFLGVPDGSFLVRAQVLKEGPNTGNSPLYYNIYSGAPNDMANVASWDLLNTGPIPFLDYQDVPSNNGEVMYAVEAIYEEGVSEPSFSNMLGFNVGMDDLSNIIGLKLYPNPAEGIARLELSLFQEEKIKVRILNALSQEVKSYPEVISNQMNETLDLVHLDAGIYWIEIQIGHELTTKKLALR